MLNIFNTQPTDVKGVRHALLQFIKEQLQKNEGGEGGIIKALQLYITCNDVERHVYESVVYAGVDDRFKTEEIQRIADDFDIALPEDWQMEILFSQPPANAIKAKEVAASLLIVTNRTQAKHQPLTAYIKVLHGETATPVYTIDSGAGKINIGREENVQTADGFYRKNTIAFIGDSASTANRSVSRQHAHIEWNESVGAFYLYADEGGLPPYNKMKVRSEGGEPWKVQTSEIGHRLQEGDQVILGESAVLEFSYRSNS